MEEKEKNIPSNKENEDSSRKLSDVIISIEGKLDSLIKLFTQLNFNTSLILDRSNKTQIFLSKMEKQLESEGMLSSTVPDDKSTVNSIENPITVADKNEGTRRTSRSESYVPTTVNQNNIPVISPEPVISKEAFLQVNNEDIVKKVPVVQRITDQEGKDLYMASVQVLDQNGKEILKTTTNAVGKWQGYLPSGNFNVKIQKIDAASKNKIEDVRSVVIPNTNKTFTLPVAIIRRK